MRPLAHSYIRIFLYSSMVHSCIVGFLPSVLICVNLWLNIFVQKLTPFRQSFTTISPTIHTGCAQIWTIAPQHFYLKFLVPASITHFLRFVHRRTPNLPFEPLCCTMSACFNQLTFDQEKQQMSQKHRFAWSVTFFVLLAAIASADVKTPRHLRRRHGPAAEEFR